MANLFEHITLGFCGWDIPALIVLVVVIAFFSVRLHNLKKERKGLEEGLKK